MNDNNSNEENEKQRIERLSKQLNQIVCICKGIKLGAVLKGIEGCKSVAEVNQKAGTGSGGCKGQRCGPRIKLLLEKLLGKK